MEQKTKYRVTPWKIDGQRVYELTDQEACELPNRVMAILKNHVGSRNAITGKRMAARLGFKDDRKVRLAIELLIESGQVIGALVKPPYGYFVIETREEAEAYAETLRSRARHTFARASGFMRAVESKLGVPYQPVLIDVE